MRSLVTSAEARAISNPSVPTSRQKRMWSGAKNTRMPKNNLVRNAVAKDITSNTTMYSNGHKKRSPLQKRNRLPKRARGKTRRVKATPRRSRIPGQQTVIGGQKRVNATLGTNVITNMHRTKKVKGKLLRPSVPLRKLRRRTRRKNQFIPINIW